MLSFFDYIYYRVCGFYYSNNSNSPRIAGLVVLSLMYLFNIVFIYGLASLLLNGNIRFSIIATVILYLIILVFNGFRYNRLNYDVLNKKWENESVTSKSKKNRWIWMYFLSTIFSIIALIFR